MARKFDREKAERAIAALRGGMTIAACAEREDVSPSTIVRWRGRLKEESQQRAAFIPAVLGDELKRSATGFVVEVGQVRVRVEPEFDAGELKRLLEVLESAGC